MDSPVHGNAVVAAVTVAIRENGSKIAYFSHSARTARAQSTVPPTQALRPRANMPKYIIQKNALAKGNNAGLDALQRDSPSESVRPLALPSNMATASAGGHPSKKVQQRRTPGPTPHPSPQTP